MSAEVDPFAVIFSTNPDEEDLIAELNTERGCVAEIRRIKENFFSIRFCAPDRTNLGELELDRFLEMIDEAKSGLQ